MLEESLSLFQRGHGEHVIRSLVIIDRKSLDIRLSYWKLLAKLRGDSRFVIGYELCCLYDTRLYLDDWDDSSPAVHLQRVCVLLARMFRVLESSFGLRMTVQLTRTSSLRTEHTGDPWDACAARAAHKARPTAGGALPNVSG